MEKSYRTFSLGQNIQLSFTSDFEDGELLDTKIEIKEIHGPLCTIAGENILDFIDELNKTLNKYSI